MSAEPLELVPLVAEQLMPKLAAALVAAQAEMPTIAKNKIANAGSYSYKYADHADIIDAVRPILAKHELAVTQDVTLSDGKVHVATVLWHSSGERAEFGPLALPAGSTAQAAGSAITYARRYALSAALNIAAEEDTDARDDSKPRNVSPRDPGTSGPARTASSPSGTTHGTNNLGEPQASAADARKGSKGKTPVDEPPAADRSEPAAPSPSLMKELDDALDVKFDGKPRVRAAFKLKLLDQLQDATNEEWQAAIKGVRA